MMTIEQALQQAQDRRDGLQEVIDKAHEKLDNIVHAGVLPIPDSIRLKALSEFVESLRDELRPHINYEPLE